MLLLNTVTLFVITIFIIFIELSIGTDDDEKVWINGMGNPTNTRRIIPSTPTNFSGQAWHLIYNTSTLNMPMKGMGIGCLNPTNIKISSPTPTPTPYVMIVYKPLKIFLMFTSIG